MTDFRDHTNAELEHAIRVPRGRRFLAAGGRSGNGHGYLAAPQRELPLVPDEPEAVERIAQATALCDEPEAVGPAVVDAQADLARHYNLLRHHGEVEQAREARRALTLEARMANVHRRAKRRHMDVSHDLHVVRKMLDRARRAGNREPATAIRRMEAVEARLDDLDAPG